MRNQIHLDFTTAHYNSKFTTGLKKFLITLSISGDIMLYRPSTLRLYKISKMHGNEIEFLCL